MSFILKFIFTFLVLSIFHTSQAQFYFGYHRSFLSYNMKGLSYDFVRFNENGSEHLSKLKSGDMQGYSIGFLETYNHLVLGMGIRQRRYTTVGDREIAPRGQENYKQNKPKKKISVFEGVYNEPNGVSKNVTEYIHLTLKGI